MVVWARPDHSLLRLIQPLNYCLVYYLPAFVTMLFSVILYKVPPRELISFGKEWLIQPSTGIQHLEALRNLSMKR